MSIKIDRISNEILRELSSIMSLEARDFLLKHITLTGCSVTNDLSYATVYYTYMGIFSKEDVKKELEKAKGYLRTVLASRIELRHTPELRFVYDNSLEYGENIERIIKEIHEKDE